MSSTVGRFTARQVAPLASCSHTVIKQYNLVPAVGQRCPEAGRSGIALAMRHRLKGSKPISKGEEHPINTPGWACRYVMKFFSEKITKFHEIFENFKAGFF